jgi:predicted anti-sigma-YlaC factor YlaD
MNCGETTLSLGAYLLGSLDSAERAEVEAHLATCAACRAESDDLAGLPSLLGRLTLDDIAPEPLEPPDDLFDRVAARARAEKAREAPNRVVRHRRLLAVAAALVLVAGAGVGSWVGLRGHDHRYNSLGRGPVHMSVTLASQSTGTGLAVTVSGLPTDEHCRLIAIAQDGTRDVAGRWNATYQGQAKETGSTSIPRSQLSKLVLLGTNGKRLATVTV